MIDGLDWSDKIRIVPAEEISCLNIRIEHVLHHGVIASIVECGISISTITSKTPVIVAAINKLLLCEGIESASLNLIAAFHSGYSRESPTRSTLTLVFYWIHSS
jgi:hypothetical protein